MDEEWLDAKCAYVDKRDRIGKVHGWLRDETDRVPVICDDGRPYALIDQRRLIRQGYHSDQTLDKVAWPVPVLGQDDSAPTALGRFAECHAPLLPVYQGEPKQPVGVLWANTLLQEAYDDGPKARACGWNVTTLGLKGNKNRAMRGFGQDLVDRLPVVGPHGPVGVVHRKDVLRWVHEANVNMGREDRLGNVSDFMDDPITSMIDERITTVDADAGFTEVKAALEDVPCAFVTHGRRIEGALTPAGVLAAIHTQKNAPYHGVTPHFTLPRHR